MEVTPPPPQKGTPQKRVLYVITKANWGGAQRYVYDMATAARDAGFEVRVATGSEGELTERLQKMGVAVVSIGSMGRDIKIGDDIRSFFELVKQVREFHPDIVQTNSSKAGGLAAVAARVGGAKRVIFTAHGWAFNENRPRWQKAIIGFIHYLTVLLSDETICVSNAIRHDARYMVGVQKRFTVIHHGVDTANGIDGMEFYDRETARARLAPEVIAPFWIGAVAELHAIKQIDVLIRAFAVAAQKHDDIFLAVLGEGQERANLEKLIQELGLTARIKLCGHVQEAPRYLKALDLFVLSSRSEALGYVILEAALAKLPVIASRVGGIPEIVRSGTSGLLVHAGNVEELADAIDLLLTHPARATKLADALFERVTHDFSKARMITRTLALYNR